jgi:hypothetical protein
MKEKKLSSLLAVEVGSEWNRANADEDSGDFGDDSLLLHISSSIYDYRSKHVQTIL